MSDAKGETFEKQSRKLWMAHGGGRASVTQLTLGCLQRMANATETLAKDHQALEDKAKYFEEDAAFYRDQVLRLERRLAATKGVVTKQRKLIARYQGAL